MRGLRQSAEFVCDCFVHRENRALNHQPPPLIAVPLDLSDEAAAKLIDFLLAIAPPGGTVYRHRPSE